MKRSKIKLSDFLTYNNLIQAFYDVKSTKKRRRDVLDFELDLGNEIKALYKELKSGAYQVSPYCHFSIYEPKERVILQPRLRDLVVQRMIYNALYDALDKKLYAHTSGTRKLKSTHYASAITQHYMRGCDANSYYLQLDIRKFFYSINTDILRSIFESKFKDKALINLLMCFAYNGVPIGNLLSGIYGLIYLTPLDNYIKRELKCKKFVRFMDDFVIMGLRREQVGVMLARIEGFLNDELGLRLSKIKINKVSQGINFVGYRTWQSKKLVRKRTIKHFKIALKANKEDSIASYLGIAKGSASYKYFKMLTNIRNKELMIA